MRPALLVMLLWTLGLAGCECDAMPFTLRVKRAYAYADAYSCASDHARVVRASR